MGLETCAKKLPPAVCRLFLETLYWGFKTVVRARSGYTYHIANVLIEWCYCTAHPLGWCLSEVKAGAKLDIEHPVFAASSNCPFLTERDVVDWGRGWYSSKIMARWTQTFKWKYIYCIHSPFQLVTGCILMTSPPLSIQLYSTNDMVFNATNDAWVIGMFYRSLNSLSFNILSENRHLFFSDQSVLNPEKASPWAVLLASVELVGCQQELWTGPKAWQMPSFVLLCKVSLTPKMLQQKQLWKEYLPLVLSLPIHLASI